MTTYPKTRDGFELTAEEEEFILKYYNPGVAQGIEQRTSNPSVGGSNPSTRTINLE